MSNITDFLHEIERLAYKILLWILLLPKTLLKIILEPKWVSGYVKKELGEDSEKSFDSFMSPVVLFLIVTLLPAVLLPFSPTSSIATYFPTTDPEDPRTFTFTVDGNFISSTNRVYHKVWWEVWLVEQVDQAGNPMLVTYWYDTDRSIIYVDENYNRIEEPVITFLYGELHDEVNGVIPYTLSDTDEPILESNPIYQSDISFIDNNSLEDYFYAYLPEGEYQIVTYVENYENPADSDPIESLNDTIYLYVPADETADYYADSATMVTSEDANPTAGSSLNLENFQGTIENGGTYFLALGLLALPLLFSFGTKVLSEDELGATSMKQSFYIQCYYFSPVTAVFWSSLYAINLYTNDIYAFAVIIPIVFFFLILIWFLGAESNAIMVERSVTKGRAWGILFMLLFILAAGAGLIYLILTDLDFLRRYSIMLYPVAGTAITIAYILRRVREHKAARQKAEEQVPI